MKDFLIIILVIVFSAFTQADENALDFYEEYIKTSSGKMHLIEDIRFTPCDSFKTSSSILSTLLFNRLKTYEEVFMVEKSLYEPMWSWARGFRSGRLSCVMTSDVNDRRVVISQLDELQKKLYDIKESTENSFKNFRYFPSKGEILMSSFKKQGGSTTLEMIKNKLDDYATQRSMNYSFETAELSIHMVMQVLSTNIPVLTLNSENNVSIIWGFVQTAEGKFFLECIPSELGEISCRGSQDEELKEMIEYCQNKALKKEYKERLTKTIHFDILTTDNIWENTGIKVITESDLLKKQSKIYFLSNVNFSDYERKLKVDMALYYMECNMKFPFGSEGYKKYLNERTKHEFNLTDEDLDSE